MADETAGQTGGVDKRAASVPLPADDGGDQVIEQQNAGPESEAVSGEWPSPGAEPTGPAPGTTPEGAEAASRRAQAPPQAHPRSSASQPDHQQDAGEGGDRGPARSGGPPASFERALHAEPVEGGSRSAPADDDAVDTSPS